MYVQLNCMRDFLWQKLKKRKKGRGLFLRKKGPGPNLRKNRPGPFLRFLTGPINRAGLDGLFE